MFSKRISKEELNSLENGSLAKIELSLGIFKFLPAYQRPTVK